MMPYWVMFSKIISPIIFFRSPEDIKVPLLDLVSDTIKLHVYGPVFLLVLSFVITVAV